MGKKQKIILISILAIIVIIGLVVVFSNEKEPPYALAEVERSSLEQIVSVTGQIIPAKKIDLQFEIQGKIEKLINDIGDEVKRNSIIAFLNKSDLNIQVLEAMAARDVARANLDKILIGASEDEIRSYEIAVENAEISLQSAETSLENKTQILNIVKSQAEETLKQAYEDALNVLDSSWLKICNAYNRVSPIQRSYFYFYDQESLKVRDNEAKIEMAKDNVKFYLDIAKNNIGADIEIALSKMKDGLNVVFNSLIIIRDVCEGAVYRNQVSSADKDYLDSHKSYINTGLTNVVNSEQTIVSGKSTNESNISTAQANVDTAQNQVLAAQGELKKAGNELTKIKSDPQQYEIDLAQSQFKQTEAGLLKAEQQLAKTNLISPCDGLITDIKKEEGEIVNQSPVISLICFGNFQIEVDIYEEDIVDIRVDNPVEIAIPAFPDEISRGRVISINPAEKLIQGIVYYEVTIELEETKEGIKPGMTADVIIESDKKENVLVIPKRAVKKIHGKKIVQVFKDGEVEEREIEIGLEGSDDLIEVVAGLEQGEKVIVD